jgi:hypothetical protein
MQRLRNSKPSHDAVYGVGAGEALGSGATGATGAAGATGAGATGATGPLAAGGLFSMFFALMPGDNAATVAVGAPVLFPQNGPTNGAATRLTAGTFNLPNVGTYEVSWQVSVTEPGQLMLAVSGNRPETVAGRATGTSQITQRVLVTTVGINSVLAVLNAPGNSTALTITPIAGGTNPVSATLIIKFLG